MTHATAIALGSSEQQHLQHRLDQIYERLLSPGFLKSEGLGNEIGFWVFDYPAAGELMVRAHIEFLEQHLATRRADLKIINLNLLEGLQRYLQHRKLADKVAAMQKAKGDKALAKALAGPLHTDKLSPWLLQQYALESQDIILLTGVGSAWPLLRAHDLLNSLHALLGHKPLLLFYPGEYTGQAMSLFGKIASNNYYRAFSLVPPTID